MILPVVKSVAGCFSRLRRVAGCFPGVRDCILTSPLFIEEVEAKQTEEFNLKLINCIKIIKGRSH